MAAIVNATNVSLYLPKDIHHNDVLHDITWSIARGEHAAVVGSNGSGKSTFLRLLGGFLWPRTGTIVWEDEQGSMQTSPLVGRRISALVSPAEQMRYQKNAWSIDGLTLVLTGFEGTPFLYAKKPKPEMLGRVRTLARELCCEDLLYRDSAQLSQGQLRILLVLRALCKEPTLLLLDECTDGLDSTHSRAVLDCLCAVAQKTTIVFVTHTPDRIPDFCTCFFQMEDGRIHGIPRPTQTSPTVFAQSSADTEHNHPVFVLKNASSYLDRVKILHDITFTIRLGERWLVVGDNGSGKSTFLRLLLGDVFCAAGGTVERWLPSLANGRGAFVESLEQIRRKMSLVSALTEVEYDYPVTALEVVLSGFENSVGLYRDYAGEEVERAKAFVQRFFAELAPQAFEALLRTPITFLSTGQLRRLFLARALICDPDVLLLDEPTSGLDAESRKLYLALLDAIASAKPTLTMCFVSHEMQYVPSCINKCARMEAGRIACMPWPLVVDR
ncbi:MAG: ATP-binding cassette domain-containing protein [Desulfovibrio sp.]|nr:ATP-binding cassette domain-containing protein [Desulfovibrio sp.]